MTLRALWAAASAVATDSLIERGECASPHAKIPSFNENFFRPLSLFLIILGFLFLSYKVIIIPIFFSNLIEKYLDSVPLIKKIVLIHSFF